MAETLQLRINTIFITDSLHFRPAPDKQASLQRWGTSSPLRRYRRCSQSLPAARFPASRFAVLAPPRTKRMLPASSRERGEKRGAELEASSTRGRRRGDSPIQGSLLGWTLALQGMLGRSFLRAAKGGRQSERERLSERAEARHVANLGRRPRTATPAGGPPGPSQGRAAADAPPPPRAAAAAPAPFGTVGARSRRPGGSCGRLLPLGGGGGSGGRIFPTD